MTKRSLTPSPAASIRRASWCWLVRRTSAWPCGACSIDTSRPGSPASSKTDRTLRQRFPALINKR